MRRPPKLVARQAAFLSTYHVDAAIIAASAALVIGADLDEAPYVSQGFGNYCDDCGRNDGTHDPEVEH
jgi:hypothetical protein